MTWQPIETAPKDGTKILVYRPLAYLTNDEDIAVKRTVNYNNFCWPETVLKGRSPVNFTNGSCYPTHWMSLPSPPKETYE